MRVLYFTDGPESPGSRFRCLQFFPALRARGIECDVRFAYDNRYNDVFDRPWAPLYKVGARMRRVAHLLGDGGYDLLYLHKTSMAVTALPERLRALRSTPMIFDFDDAVFLGPGGVTSARRQRTFEHIVSLASHVVAGNRFLAERSAAPAKTTVIPSVVDAEHYRPGVTTIGGPMVIGWIGTASNFPYLRPVIPHVLRAIEQLPGARLRIVSNGVVAEYQRHPQVEQWRWREDRELAALQTFDIGLMPLADNVQTRGKCGFKMIQYMATGVPVLASAVGANREIFEGSEAGFLIEHESEWTPRILKLAQQPQLRQACAEHGRTHTVAHYSVDAVLDRYVDIFNRVARRGRPATAA